MERTAEKENLVANVEWFNHFFEGLRYLVDATSEVLADELGLKQGSFYYPKSNHQPSLPDYWMHGMYDDNYALQIFFVLQPGILEHPRFKREPSFILVKHGSPNDSLSPSAYGLRVMSNDGLRLVIDEVGRLSGSFVQQEADGVGFAAAQVLMDAFMENGDAKDAVRSQFLSAVRGLELPGSMKPQA